MKVFVLQGSRRVYELEVRNQAEALEKQLRRGTYRDSLVASQTCPDKYYVHTLCAFISTHSVPVSVTYNSAIVGAYVFIPPCVWF